MFITILSYARVIQLSMRHVTSIGAAVGSAIGATIGRCQR
jgi:hypothetical protein